MRMWEAGNRLNMSNIDSFTITPPAAVACLLHWKVMACVLQHLPLEAQTEVKISEQECDYGGDPVDLRCLPALGQLVDSHCHIDLLLRMHHVDSIPMLSEKVRQREWNLHYVVRNYVFPKHWHTLHPHVSSHDNINATVGLHPHVASKSSRLDTHIHTMETLLRHPKCVGVGEIGLDYHRHQRPRERENQRQMLVPQLHMAVKYSKSVIIHLRPDKSDTTHQCLDDCLQIMTNILPKTHKVHVHSFCGDNEDMMAWLHAFPEAVVVLSGTLLRVESGSEEEKAVCSLDLNKILLESDAPYLTPPRKPGPNHPWNDCSRAVILLSKYRYLDSRFKCYEIFCI